MAQIDIQYCKALNIFTIKNIDNGKSKTATYEDFIKAGKPFQIIADRLIREAKGE